MRESRLFGKIWSTHTYNDFYLCNIQRPFNVVVHSPARPAQGASFVAMAAWALGGSGGFFSHTTTAAIIIL
jgi:hypothetical protein